MFEDRNNKCSLNSLILVRKTRQNLKRVNSLFDVILLYVDRISSRLLDLAISSLILKVKIINPNKSEIEWDRFGIILSFFINHHVHIIRQ